MTKPTCAEDALKAAAQRLLAVQPGADGARLTVARLAKEAGVSRATAYRAADIIRMFRAELRSRNGTGAAAAASKKTSAYGEIRELRATAHAMAQRIQVLTLLAAEQERKIAALHDELSRRGGAAIVPLGRGADA